MVRFRHFTRRAARSVAAALFMLATTLVPFHAARTAEPSNAEGKLSIHGYGEVHYNNPETGTMNEDAPAMVDVHRLVLGWEYDFSPILRMSAEIDYEHSASEIELEYAHVEYDLSPTLSLRAGSLLMPVGPLNEFHEPPTYHSVERPYVQNSVIPTTWQEIGFGLVGRASGGALGYRAYVVSGLDAQGFSGGSGIRGGRQHGVEAKAEDLALVGRLEYAARGGISLGASAYYGGADQGALGLGDVTVTLATADVHVRRGALDLRGVGATGSIENSDSISNVIGSSVGSRFYGAYGEAAFDLLHGRGASADGGRQLWIFGRLERFDTMADTATGVTDSPAAERTVITGGVAYHPVPELAFKADVEHWEDGADVELNRLNVGVAFQF